MSAYVKYHVIYRHRREYTVRAMCRFFDVSRSGYYAFVLRLGKLEKDAVLAEMIAEQRERSLRTYGYRRMGLAVLREYRETVDSRWMFPSPVKEDCPIQTAWRR